MIRSPTDVNIYILIDEKKNKKKYIMSRKQVINYTHTSTPSVQHIIVMLTEIFDTSMQFHVALIDRER